MKPPASSALSGRRLVAALLMLASCEADPSRSAGNASPPGSCDGVTHRAPASSAAYADRPFAGRVVRRTDLEALIPSADSTPYTGEKHDLTSVLVLDLDADGRADLLYSRSRTRSAWWVSQPSPGVFRNEGMIPPPLNTCEAAADFDGDGFTDVLCASRVVWGTARGVDWRSVTAAIDSTQAPMSTTLADLDEDGLLDVVMGYFGDPKAVLRNRGNRTFEDMAPRWGLAMAGLTWCVGLVDFDRDGRDDVFMMHDGSNKPNAAFRALGPGPDGEPRFERVSPMPTACDRDGFFRDGNLTPMGAAVGDVDLDGSPDVYLGSLAGALLLRQDDGRWLDTLWDFDIATPTTETGRPLIPWSPVLWDVDHDGRLDLLLSGGDDDGHAQQPGRGASHNLLYQGRAGNRFDDVHTLVGLDAAGHFQNITVADLDGDLDLDLVFGAFGAPPAVYENQIAPAGAHLLLSLRGRFSNPPGFGGRVEVTAGGATRTYPVGARFNPQVADDGVIDVALGAGSVADLVRVTWPSGYVQEVRGLAAGRRHVVEEPALVTLDPPTRHVRAGGTDLVRVTVRPADAAGAPRAGARVEVRAAGGAAFEWAGPEETAADGSVVRSLRPPAAAGSATLEVLVDGVAYRVRPRVWFD